MTRIGDGVKPVVKPVVIAWYGEVRYDEPTPWKI
jgi:hypothetical protein